MSVTQHTPITTFTGNGSTVAVAFDWPALEAADIKVKIDGVEKTLNVDFTVNVTTKIVTFAAAPASGAVCVVYRSSVLSRFADYQVAGDFPAPVVNNDFDRLWLVFNELVNGSRGIPSSLRVPAGETVAELPARASRLGKVLTFDPVTGEPIASTPASGTAADVLTQLASSLTELVGAALVGFNVIRGYAFGSVAYFLRGQPIDVRHFGAKGDFNGTTGTDDTTAIRAAMTFAQLASNMGTFGSDSPGVGYPASLYFPDGNYKISDNLPVTEPLHIQGAKAGEHSSGARITQTNPNKDIFSITPQASGSSFSIDRMVLRGPGTSGTGVHVNVGRSGAAYCNSQRYTNSVFSQPPSGVSMVLMGDDIHVDHCLFDVATLGSMAGIQLGTNTTGDKATQVRITGTNFFACTGRALLVYNAENVLFGKNQVSQTLDPTKTQYVIDALNTAPVLVRGLNITGNNIRGGRMLLGISSSTTAENIAFTDNVCYECGGGAGETLDGFRFGGAIAGLNISGNIIKGSWDTKSVYSDALTSAVSSAVITGNVFINGGGTGRALDCAKTSGRIYGNDFTGYTTPSVSEKFTTGTITPGSIAGAATFTSSQTVNGAVVGDKVEFRATGAWPALTGVVMTGVVDAANTAKIRYSNVTGSSISQTAHTLIVEVTR
jgi:hypothetical protein